MEEDEELQVLSALNLVVTTVEQSSNMRKALKQNIFDTVSTLRHLFEKIKISSECKLSEIKDLTKKVSKLEDELRSSRQKLDKVQQAPSIANSAEQNDQRLGQLESISVGVTTELFGKGAQRVALPTGNMNRQYSSVVRESKPKKYKMTVKARSSLPSEEIKQILKNKINPGEIKVGVNSLKSLQCGSINRDKHQRRDRGAG
jgi:cell division septum initiation protein DivIVA